MKKLLLCLAGALVLITLVAIMKSRFEQPNTEAEISAICGIVETYIKADMNGANLGTDNFEESGLEKILVAGEESASGWDTVSLVRSYRLNSIETQKVKGQNLATASVSFEIVGEVPGAVEVIRQKEMEKYVFRLVKQGNAWKLVQPFDLQPHVSIETLIKHLKTLLGQEHQEKVPEVIRQLEKMKDNV